MSNLVRFPTKERPQAATPDQILSMKAKAIRTGYLGTDREIGDAVAECNTFYHSDGGYVDGQQALIGLVEGAMIAFREGRPENLQKLLELTPSCNYTHEIEIAVIGKLEESRNTTGGDVITAIQTMTPQSRAAFLDHGMLRGIEGKNHHFVKALLLAGAKADGGSASHAFFRAAARRKDLDMVRILHEKGAQFDEAIRMARVDGYAPEQQQLRDYQRVLEPKPDGPVMGFLKTIF